MIAEQRVARHGLHDARNDSRFEAGAMFSSAHGDVAQLAVRRALDAEVVGSTPTVLAILIP